MRTRVFVRARNSRALSCRQARPSSPTRTCVIASMLSSLPTAAATASPSSRCALPALSASGFYVLCSFLYLGTSRIVRNCLPACSRSELSVARQASPSTICGLHVDGPILEMHQQQHPHHHPHRAHSACPASCQFLASVLQASCTFLVRVL